MPVTRVALLAYHPAAPIPCLEGSTVIVLSIPPCRDSVTAASVTMPVNICLRAPTTPPIRVARIAVDTPSFFWLVVRRRFSNPLVRYAPLTMNAIVVAFDESVTICTATITLAVSVMLVLVVGVAGVAGSTVVVAPVLDTEPAAPPTCTVGLGPAWVLRSVAEIRASRITRLIIWADGKGW